LFEDSLRVEAVLQLDDETQALVAVGEVFQVRDALQFLGLHQLLNAADDLLRADVVGQLGDNQAGAARGQLLDGDGGADPEGAAAFRVGVPDPVQPGDGPPGGQVRAGDELHEFFEGGVRVGEEVPGR